MYVFKRIDVKNNESILFFLLFAVATYHTADTPRSACVCAITGLTNATPSVGYFVYSAMVLLLCWLAWLVRIKYTLTIDEQTRRARQAPVCRRHRRRRRRALSLCYAGRRRKTPLVRSFVHPVCPGRPSTRPLRHLRHRYKPTIGERQSLESINPTREPSTTTTNFVLCIYIYAHTTSSGNIM